MEGASTARSDDPHLLLDVAAAVAARAAGPAWDVRVGATWCRLRPAEATLPPQGWKLHVSATLLSAPLVLHRVASVLVEHGCPFKFSRDLATLRSLLSSSVDRGSGGKFITAYPHSDAEFTRLARLLDEATAGLPGPAILSDRPVRPGGIVHYRFGGFDAPGDLTQEGALVRLLVAPDGSRERDERTPRYRRPVWATPPLPEPPPAPRAGAVILGDRFVVRTAIRHSYRGGVYRAVDQETSAEVVVKQARPHVMPAPDGTDVRDRLRHEATMLERLAPLGVAPRPIALFEQQDSVFLAEDLVPGTTLARWAAARSVGEWRGSGPPVAAAVTLASALVRLVADVHSVGLVLRDFTPNNVMVQPDGRLRLVDLELAVPAGTSVWRMLTAGFAAPEILDGPAYGPAGRPGDLYALGATVLQSACGRTPVFARDRPGARPPRLGELVERMGRDLPAVRQLAPLVLGLTQADPTARWSLQRATDFLSSVDDQTSTVDDRPSDVDSAVSTVEPLAESGLDALLADGFEFLVAEMAPEGRELWRAGDFGAPTDPCTVQHGAAGVLGVLTGAARVLDAAPLRDAVATAVGWLDQRLFSVPRLLPGLYFGRAGTAWAQYDAATLVGDDRAAGRALDLARRLPAVWPNPDVCHGAAGAGLTYLHLHHATGDRELGRLAAAAAHGVLAAAREHGGELLWPVPADFDSTFAGAVQYGFGHGVAGIAAFLLYASVATGREDWLDAARRAGDTLVAAADVTDGCAWWPVGPRTADGSAAVPGPAGEDDEPERWAHWCSGSAGVGAYLIRLWAVTGEPRYRELAEAAGAAVRRDRWYATTSACHGLSGHGELLLDLADLTGDLTHRVAAAELADVMYVQRAVRDGRTLLPDETATDFTAGYNSGLAGVLGFLLRLRHGGPRWWLPDELLPTPRLAAGVPPLAAVTRV